MYVYADEKGQVARIRCIDSATDPTDAAPDGLRVQLRYDVIHSRGLGLGPRQKYVPTDNCI